MASGNGLPAGTAGVPSVLGKDPASGQRSKLRSTDSRAGVEPTQLAGVPSSETTKAALRRAVRHFWRHGIVPAIHGRHPFGAALRAARGARVLWTPVHDCAGHPWPAPLRDCAPRCARCSRSLDSCPRLCRPSMTGTPSGLRSALRAVLAFFGLLSTIVPAIHSRHPFGTALRAARGARVLPASCLSSRTRSGSRPSLSARNDEGRLSAAFVFSGGERGIRTLDGCFCTHTPLAGEPLRPLGHLSVTVRNRLQGPRPRCRLPCESSGKSLRGVLRRPSAR